MNACSHCGTVNPTVSLVEIDCTTSYLCQKCFDNLFVATIPVADVQKVIEEFETRRDSGIGKRHTYNVVITRLQALLPKEEEQPNE